MFVFLVFVSFGIEDLVVGGKEKCLSTEFSRYNPAFQYAKNILPV